MTNKERVAKLLADIKVSDEESSVGLILTYTMEIRRDTEIRCDMDYCDEMFRSTSYAVEEWKHRAEQSRHRLALIRGKETDE